MSFATNQNKGFHITFPNGKTFSTQFGGGNYSSNRDFEIGREKDVPQMRADTAEVAVWGKDGDWITREVAIAAGLGDPGDDVMGWVNMETWLKLFDAARKEVA